MKVEQIWRFCKPHGFWTQNFCKGSRRILQGHCPKSFSPPSSRYIKENSRPKFGVNGPLLVLKSTLYCRKIQLTFCHLAIVSSVLRNSSQSTGAPKAQSRGPLSHGLQQLGPSVGKTGHTSGIFLPSNQAFSLPHSRLQTEHLAYHLIRIVRKERHLVGY